MERVKVALGFYKNGNKEEVLDCTDDLKNWDDVTISLTRSDYTGVVRSISSQFEFVGETKEKINNYYNEFYLNTQIKVNVYQINESWLYDLIFQGDLDFSTLQMDELVLSINAKDNTLASVIKANKSTKFDIPTVDVRADKKFKYDRINILNRVQWTTDDANEETTEPYKFKLTQEIPEIGTYYIPIPLAYMSSETYRCPFEYRDQAQELIKIGDGNITEPTGIVTAINRNSFRINTKFRCTLKSGVNTASIVIGKTNSTPIAEKVIALGIDTIVNLNAPVIHAKGQTFGVFIKVTTTEANTNVVFEYTAPSEKDGYYTRGSIAYAECFGKGKETEFNCVDITKLANTLVRKIYPTASVEIDPLPTQCILVSGEDMRGLNNAKISTSFNEFSAFMETCFGFTYTINNGVVRYGKREDLFVNTIVKEITSYSDLNFSQDTSLMYSRVKVGYNKQDYNNSNGKNEFNQSIEYSTDVNLTDNTLELISPYRADGYGFEFKVQEIENEVRDNTFSLEDEDKQEVDKDIFAIEVNETDSYYTPNKENIGLIPGQVFSNGADFGILELYILKSVKEEYEVGDFVNYYFTSYQKNISTGVATLIFSSVSETGAIDYNISVRFEIQSKDIGIETYTNDDAVITIDWEKFNLKIDPFMATQNNSLNYPISYTCFKRDVLNYNLNPRLCAERNQFMYLPCTQNLKFASTDGNADIKFYNNSLICLNSDLSFGGRDMLVNKITFTTDETVLPKDKSGKVRLVANGKTYDGWIINATQNIGKNEPSEYELILAHG